MQFKRYSEISFGIKYGMIRNVEILAMDLCPGIHIQPSFLHNERRNQVVIHQGNMKRIFDDEQICFQTIWAVIRYHDIIDGDTLELGDFITERIDISEQTSLLNNCSLCSDNYHVDMRIEFRRRRLGVIG